jgi:hypothetical protein
MVDPRDSEPRHRMHCAQSRRMLPELANAGIQMLKASRFMSAGGSLRRGWNFRTILAGASASSAPAVLFAPLELCQLAFSRVAYQQRETILNHFSVGWSRKFPCALLRYKVPYRRTNNLRGAFKAIAPGIDNEIVV